jgi:AcrR family transcriptional regulator
VSQQTRHRILDAARNLFVENGEAAVTMRAVAKRAGVSTMAAYRHFPNRDALITAVCALGHDKFLACLHQALAAPGPLERLGAAGQAYLDFALACPRDYELMFLRTAKADLTGGPPASRDAATFRFLIDRVAECQAAGLFEPGDPEVAALSIWAHVHGLVSLFLAHKLQADAATFRSLYARVTAAELPPRG